jgi:ubiquitin fusion degradation protein 1
MNFPGCVPIVRVLPPCYADQRPSHSGLPPGFPGARRPNPRSYDEYLKAYSMAMLPGRERENVSYGGKSTRHLLFHNTIDCVLTPWMMIAQFSCRNPRSLV